MATTFSTSPIPRQCPRRRTGPERSEEMRQKNASSGESVGEDASAGVLRKEEAELLAGCIERALHLLKHYEVPRQGESQDWHEIFGMWLCVPYQFSEGLAMPSITRNSLDPLAG
jgi:hypothetical protein